jgi:hypothetical protein
LAATVFNGKGFSKMKISIAVSTYNRAGHWRRGQLVSSLLTQRDLDFELLVCDDNSIDGTMFALRSVLRDLPFPVRVFRTSVEKKICSQASALPQNVMIREAAGDVMLFLDDDGWIDDRCISYLRTLEFPAVYYGEIVFVDPVCNTRVISADCRVHTFSEPCDLHQMHKQHLATWGALWAAPTKTLRQIGGHEATEACYRGSDYRLGSRLLCLPSFFVTNAAFRFWHFGHSYFQQNKHDMKRLKETHRSASTCGLQFMPTVANDGLAYWDSPQIAGAYHEVIFA